MLDVANVIWCTGFRPDFSWIDLPICTADDREPVHRAGEASCPRRRACTSSGWSSCRVLVVAAAGRRPGRETCRRRDHVPHVARSQDCLTAVGLAVDHAVEDTEPLAG
jgi:hypothetical protein